MTRNVSWRTKLQELQRVLLFRPLQMGLLVVLGVLTAVMEGIGLSFIIPLVQQVGGSTSESNIFVKTFTTIYHALGVQVTIGTLLVGVAVVLTFRYMGSFAITWLREIIRSAYIRKLQTDAYENLLAADVAYFDEHGSDEILNAIITQTREGAHAIYSLGRLIEMGFLTLIYIGIMMYIAFVPTLVLGLALGVLAVALRFGLAPGYTFGDEIADANERLQEVIQAGAQAIREVKVFDIRDELFSKYEDAITQYVDARVRKRRNQSILINIQQLIVALVALIFVYVALVLFALPLEFVALLLFAMVRLGPNVSNLNNILYDLDTYLAHEVRTQQFIDDLRNRNEPTGGTETVPDRIERIRFEDVSFTYQDNLSVLRNLSLDIEGGQRVAFVGRSGTGKSTIISLLTRFYRPTSGSITVNGIPLEKLDLQEWRDRIALVRQTPYIFNETLRYNLTLGDRDATESEIEQACELAGVTEFLDDLSDGYETVLGDEGVRLSGGQKQRVAIARAVIKAGDGDLLILDEATSEVDSRLEERIYLAIERLDLDLTVLIIAHHLSSVRNVDRIYALAEGRISESGSHPELLDNGGVYADLYSE